MRADLVVLWFFKVFKQVTCVYFCFAFFWSVSSFGFSYRQTYNCWISLAGLEIRVDSVSLCSEGGTPPLSFAKRSLVFLSKKSHLMSLILILQIISNIFLGNRAWRLQPSNRVHLIDLGPRLALARFAPSYISQKIDCSLEMQFLAKPRAAENAKYYKSIARARFTLLVHWNRKSHKRF